MQHARALHKTQDASTTNAYGQRQWHGNLLDVCSHRIPLLARTAYTTVQHYPCDATRRHPNPKNGGVALFYWININVDARPTEAGAVEKFEPSCTPGHPAMDRTNSEKLSQVWEPRVVNAKKRAACWALNPTLAIERHNAPHWPWPARVTQGVGCGGSIR